MLVQYRFADENGANHLCTTASAAVFLVGHLKKELLWPPARQIGSPKCNETTLIHCVFDFDQLLSNTCKSNLL